MNEKQRRKLILEVVDNQIRDHNPPETKQTLERLMVEGFSKEQAREMIGCVVVSEMFDLLKKGEVYNERRYIAALNNLPDMSED
ncbi:MAG: hypothetical protein GY869_27325 [Planctomycetes bacterium]|nr:hypothetical protein [Planctomycetota bacterium]